MTKTRCAVLASLLVVTSLIPVSTAAGIDTGGMTARGGSLQRISRKSLPFTPGSPRAPEVKSVRPLTVNTLEQRSRSEKIDRSLQAEIAASEQQKAVRDVIVTTKVDPAEMSSRLKGIQIMHRVRP